MKKILTGGLLVIASLFMLSTTTVSAGPLAGVFCKGDFAFDGDVDADDVTTFLEHFGRSQYYDPCPPDGPTPVAKTGQTTSYATGDDGDLERGVTLVTPRFTDNLDGTVTDNQTGLIWLKDANCFGLRTWNQAISDCNGLSSGSCGLSDGSSAGDWRLPNLRELQSPIDYGKVAPALPTGYPFDSVELFSYWSSTTTTGDIPNGVWLVNLYDGAVHGVHKTGSYYVWCVRGGH